MNKQINIPKIPHTFFKWYCRQERYEELHGDLEEFFYERAAEKGLSRARLYYLLDVIRCCQPYAWKKTKGQTNSNLIMFRNYYFTATRNLVKHKNYFLLNISGLAIGIASFILISLYLVNELSYDRFHANFENTYRVQTKGNINGQIVDWATSNPPLAKTLLNEYPETARATRIRRSGSWFISREDQKFYEDGVLFADSTFFQVFDFKLLAGDPKTALVHPRSMVLTETYARKYFGDEDPMGKEIAVEQDTIFYKVTGIAENIPANSHIQFDMLGSMSSYDEWNDDGWVDSGINYTYVVLHENAVIASLEEKIQEIIPKYIGPEIEYYTGRTYAEWQKAGNSTSFYLMPLKKIHLQSEASNDLGVPGNSSYLYIYGLVGIIILFIAIFNFVNLATAQSATRAREVGVRKVMGSTKTALVYQFIFESVIVSLIATVLAVIIVVVVMPSFIDLVGKELAFSMGSSYLGPLLIVGLAFMVGFLAGCYPAFVLSTFQPVEVLKGTLRPGSKSGWMRNFLVIIQFTASIMIITGTLVIYHQIDFMLTKNLGFDKEQILVVRKPELLKTHLDAFKNDLLQNPAIKTVVNSKTIPGKEYAKRSYRKQGAPETFLFMHNHVNFDYRELMGLELVSGRFFSKAHKQDTNAVVINVAAAKAFGFEDPIGQKLTTPWKPGQLVEIIGVVKDYHTESLHKRIEPIALELIPNNTSGYVSMKISNGEAIRETIAYVQDTWSKHTDKPFDYFFFDEDYEHLYRSEATTGQIFVVFAILSIFIACLGLIGLITFTASVRKKEIGIRKVLGAGTRSLIRLLSNDIVRPMMIATLLACPIAFLASDYWLQNFASRISISPWSYILSTCIVILIGSIAISFQTIKATRNNPVDSLRQE
ncbi:ABC transporter permease [Fulvivirgaceae bacterium BMA10]|uniref:ABC transporter permease n=1 Tax=Splendidivirga corallicola TaxID=3051826 RepID=A0ABT8KXJ4_9BACT|nr:ABC transporter permease [Fulvivirgaceae bacterium BMA10]